MGDFVVKFHKWILGIAAILLIPCLFGFLNTRVNYDMLNYLPDSMETVQGQKELLDNFHKGAFSMVITEGIDANTESTIINEISKVNHVDTVAGLGSLEQAGIPAEILPDNIYNTFHNNIYYALLQYHSLQHLRILL